MYPGGPSIYVGRDDIPRGRRKRTFCDTNGPMGMRFLPLLMALLLAGGAYAQHDAAVDRAILERDQQSEDFALRQQQQLREQSTTTNAERQKLYSEHALQRSAQEREHREERHRLNTLPRSNDPAAQAARHAERLRARQR